MSKRRSAVGFPQEREIQTHNPDNPSTERRCAARIIVRPAMPSARSSLAPRRLPLLFLAVMLIPVVALAWLTSQLLERDGRLQDQQVQQRVERAADQVVAALHQRLSELEGTLRRITAGERTSPPAHTVVAVATGGRRSAVL